jgi:hypothetical protein
MKAWHVVVAGGGLLALWYVLKSTGPAVTQVPAGLTSPPGAPPAIYAPSPVIATGPTVEARTGRGHF